MKNNDASGIFAKCRGVIACREKPGPLPRAEGARDGTKMSPAGSGAKWIFDHKCLHQTGALNVRGHALAPGS